MPSRVDDYSKHCVSIFKCSMEFVVFIFCCLLLVFTGLALYIGKWKSFMADLAIVQNLNERGIFSRNKHFEKSSQCFLFIYVYMRMCVYFVWMCWRLLISPPNTHFSYFNLKLLRYLNWMSRRSLARLESINKFCNVFFLERIKCYKREHHCSGSSRQLAPGIVRDKLWKKISVFYEFVTLGIVTIQLSVVNISRHMRI